MICILFISTVSTKNILWDDNCCQFTVLLLILQHVDEQIRTLRSLHHSNLATLTHTHSLVHNNKNTVFTFHDNSKLWSGKWKLLPTSNLCAEVKHTNGDYCGPLL